MTALMLRELASSVLNTTGSAVASGRLPGGAGRAASIAAVSATPPDTAIATVPSSPPVLLAAAAVVNAVVNK